MRKDFVIKAMEKRYEEMDEAFDLLNKAEWLIRFGHCNDEKTGKEIEKIKEKIAKEKSDLVDKIIELERSKDEMI